jgi:hypothetical protein
MQDHDLDALFSAARAAPPVPSQALMARVMADALAEQPNPVAAGAVTAPARRVRFWEPLAALFGGIGPLAGMGGAAVAGLLIGYVQPTGLASVSDVFLGATLDSIQLMPSLDPLLDEVSQ